MNVPAQMKAGVQGFDSVMDRAAAFVRTSAFQIGDTKRRRMSDKHRTLRATIEKRDSLCFFETLIPRFIQACRYLEAQTEKRYPTNLDVLAVQNMNIVLLSESHP
jgi:hypothetical protein